jgi:hypothetical protein
MACKNGEQKDAEPNQLEAERRRHERRQRDEPVLLDTRAPGERRRGVRREDHEPEQTQQGRENDRREP